MNCHRTASPPQDSFRWPTSEFLSHLPSQYNSPAAHAEDTEFYMDVISTAKEIGSSLTKVSTQLSKAEDIIDDTTTNTNALSKNIKNVQKDLTAISKDLERIEGYSEDLPEELANLRKTISSLTILMDNIISEIEKNSDKDATEILKIIDKIELLTKSVQVLEKDAKKVHLTAQNMLSLLEKDLSITQNQIHSSATGVIDGTQNLLKDLKGVTNQSSNLKKAKNQIHDIITSDIDDIENKTTMFNINPDDRIISYASEKNESPNKVQIFVQSASIKEVISGDIADLEPKKEETSFWQKIVAIFEKIRMFFEGIFKK